jgi:hypothetical protein
MKISEIVDLITVGNYIKTIRETSLVDNTKSKELSYLSSFIDKKIIDVITSPDFKSSLSNDYDEESKQAVMGAVLNNVKSSLRNK